MEEEKINHKECLNYKIDSNKKITCGYIEKNCACQSNEPNKNGLYECWKKINQK
jgi:hypothetical protein